MTKSIDQHRLVAAGRSNGKTFRCQLFTTSSAFYAQSAQMIKAVYALVINMNAFTAQ